MSRPRIIFMGTPAFATPALAALARREDVEVALVVTQPDRPAGRGKTLTSPAVKTAADSLDLTVLQTDSLRHPEVKDRIRAVEPDLVVVAAFGMMLGSWILNLPTRGCVNLHASLLPKYRGASPISAAIRHGEVTTGVTLMQMDRGLDTGDMLDSIEVPIGADDTTLSLTPKLAHAAADLLDRRLSDVLSGAIIAVPQPEGATETHLVSKAEGRIDWSQGAADIERHVRAMWDWPRAWATLPTGEHLQIHASSVAPGIGLGIGEVHREGAAVLIGCAESSLKIEIVQFPGGKPLRDHGLVQRFVSLEGEKLA